MFLFYFIRFYIIIMIIIIFKYRGDFNSGFSGAADEIQ
jgi:hypothetical protein